MTKSLIDCCFITLIKLYTQQTPSVRSHDVTMSYLSCGTPARPERRPATRWRRGPGQEPTAGGVDHISSFCPLREHKESERLLGTCITETTACHKQARSARTQTMVCVCVFLYHGMAQHGYAPASER